MRVAALLVIGALFVTGIMWLGTASNRMYDMQVTPIGTSSVSRSDMISIAYENPDDVKVSQMSNLPANPPIDDQLPENLRVASFALG